MLRTTLLLLLALLVCDTAAAQHFGKLHHRKRNSDPCADGSGGAGGGIFRSTTANFDRPFPLGAVTDAFWETQQTNAEAADFIFYDHEFVGETAQLTPAAKRHLEQVALRLEHVPFPIVIEKSEHNYKPALDRQRRQLVVEQLARLGVQNAEGRVVIADSFAEGIPAVQGEQGYYMTIGGGFNGGAGNRFGGRGGFFR